MHDNGDFDESFKSEDDESNQESNYRLHCKNKDSYIENFVIWLSVSLFTHFSEIGDIIWLHICFNRLFCKIK